MDNTEERKNLLDACISGILSLTDEEFRLLEMLWREYMGEAQSA